MTLAIKLPERLVQAHPECEKMHRAGYCVCSMVECIWCERPHPPHKPHAPAPEPAP